MDINVDFICIYQKDIYLLESASETSPGKFIEHLLRISAYANTQMYIFSSAEYTWWNQLWGFLVWMIVMSSSVSFFSPKTTTTTIAVKDKMP